MAVLAVDFNFIDGLFFLLGGLGIFLYGLNLMGDSLKALAGNRMKSIIEKTTNTPLKGIFVGAIVTVLLQSSSGTTALTIGLVRAGLMTLPQAVGVILGANIGTTATAFLIGLNIGEYALPLIGVGAILVFFSTRKKYKSMGGALLGFGMLFFGLDLMGEGLKPLSQTATAMQLFETMSKQPFLGLAFGTVITVLVQSSSAAIGALQKLYESGAITLIGALPILFGSNIGSTITAVMAAIGGTTASKRAAVVHVIFNIIGAIIFMIILYPAFYPLMAFIESRFLQGFGETPMMTIAVAHMIFNIVMALIMVWFVKHLVFISTKIIRGEDYSAVTLELCHDTLINESPTVALAVAKRALQQMGNIALSFFKITKQYSFKETNKLLGEGQEMEKTINEMDKYIHDYLIKIAQKGTNRNETNTLSKYLDTIRDLERIGDHCSNLFEFFEERYAQGQVLSEEAEHDLQIMYDALEMMLEQALDSLFENNLALAHIVLQREELIDKMEEKYRFRHMERLKSGQCTIANSDFYVDILSNLERVGDHCNNIAQNVVSPKRYELMKDDL